jgi:hypothetical protein
LPAIHKFAHTQNFGAHDSHNLIVSLQEHVQQRENGLQNFVEFKGE